MLHCYIPFRDQYRLVLECVLFHLKKKYLNLDNLLLSYFTRLSFYHEIFTMIVRHCPLGILLSIFCRPRLSQQFRQLLRGLHNPPVPAALGKRPGSGAAARPETLWGLSQNGTPINGWFVVENPGL